MLNPLRDLDLVTHVLGLVGIGADRAHGPGAHGHDHRDHDEHDGPKWCGCPLPHAWAACPFAHRSKAFPAATLRVCPDGAACYDRFRCTAAHPAAPGDSGRSVVAVCRTKHSAAQKARCPYSHDPAPARRFKTRVCPQGDACKDRLRCLAAHPAARPARCACADWASCTLSHQPATHTTAACPHGRRCRQWRRGACELAHV